MILNEMKRYRNVFLETNPLYWFTYARSKFRKRTEKDLEKYKCVPQKLSFRFIAPSDELLSGEIEITKEQRQRIIELADEVCENQYTVFGVKIPDITAVWSSDPETGYTWPNVLYSDVRKYAPPGRKIDGDNDIKCPWELCSMHFLVTLAQAFVLTRNDKYYNKYFELIDSWIEQNPMGYGVNWCCSMDVAIRAINIIIAASILHTVSNDMERDFSKYHEMLYQHMLFVRDNLEYGLARENHFLSDIVGLKMIAQCFPEDSTAKEIYRFALKTFLGEITYEICADGVDNEASTCYHALVFELFLIGIATDEKASRKLSTRAKQRIKRMRDFTQELCEFEMYPIVGDNDSGRILDMTAQQLQKKELVCFCDALFDSSKIGGDPYSKWLSVMSVSPVGDNNILKNCVQDYKQGGFGIYSNGVFRIMLHAGSIGRKGMGSHGHNDQLSFVLDCKGESFIIDPGSYVYERHLIQRDRFRGTGVHNVPQLGSYEQNTISPDKPFKMKHESFADFSVTGDSKQGEINGLHKGYCNKAGCIVKRTVRIDQNEVSVEDIISGSYTGKVSMLFTLAPDVEVEETEQGILLRKKNTLLFQAHRCKAIIENAEYSLNYNEKNSTKAIRLEWEKVEPEMKLMIIIKKYLGNS